MVKCCEGSLLLWCLLLGANAGQDRDEGCQQVRGAGFQAT